MSNQKGLAEFQIEKIKYLDLLGSHDFPALLDSYNLSFELYHKLFAAHILTIGFQSTGIREGSVTLEYYQTHDKELKNYHPKINFAFITTKNSLIENRLGSGYGSSHIHNKNPKNEFKYNNKQYYNPYSFKNFLLDYQAKLIILDDMEHAYLSQLFKSDKDSPTIRIKFNKSYNASKTEKIDFAFQSIIIEHPEIYKFLQFHFLNNELSQDSHVKPKLKI